MQNFANGIDNTKAITVHVQHDTRQMNLIRTVLLQSIHCMYGLRPLYRSIVENSQGVCQVN